MDNDIDRPSTSNSSCSHYSGNSSGIGRKLLPRRNMKRKTYNENSEDEESHENFECSKQVTQRSQGIKRRRTNTRRNERLNYNENVSDDDSNHLQSSEPNPIVSVSSRGRIRKLTAKARDYACR